MRVFFVADTKDLTPKLFLDAVRKYVKGFVRLGHDTQVFSCSHALFSANSVAWRALSKRYSKKRAVETLLQQLRLYKPDLVFVGLPKMIDAKTILCMREVAPKAFFMGIESDVRPEERPGRVEAASKLDLLFTAFGSNGQHALIRAGASCLFMPNACDPDVERRYPVSDRWHSDVVFTGKLRHRSTATEQLRPDIITRLASLSRCAVYGCWNRPFLAGIDYYYAISGAKMGLSINVANDIQLYHSDRLTHYLACGTLVLARSVPDSDRMFQDGVHLRYFDTEDQFFDLVERYLREEMEREKIACAGMEWIHSEFNQVKIVQHMLEAVETGSYRAPWMR
ncbi:MAG: glycosyltransferase family 1 protein [Acidobacteria bacterium]|nr:MAG: glycosyltransferase family 1 protein [Acidobacteriota bacterium]